MEKLLHKLRFVRRLPVLLLLAAVFFVGDRLVGTDSILHTSESTAVIEEKQGTADTTTSLLTADPDTLEGPYAVDRVVDGDTLYIINDQGEKEKVRLIGVDTPESVHPDASKNTEEGKTASDYTKSLLEGKQVWLEYDEDRTDVYGRTLAYVYIADDTDTLVMLEDILLYNGMAQVLTVQPNDKYADHFAALYSSTTISTG